MNTQIPPEEQYTSIPANSSDSEHIYWFPMKVTPSRCLKICELLKNQGVEYFFPYDEKVEFDTEKYEITQTPKIDDLIFVKGTKPQLTALKHSGTLLRFMRFVTFIPQSKLRNDMTRLERRAVNRIMVIPDAEMEQFIKVVSQESTRVSLLPFSDSLKQIGHKIRIIQGPLAGIIGTLRRISNNKHIHIDCGNLITIQIDYMPKAMYEKLD